MGQNVMDKVLAAMVLLFAIGASGVSAQELHPQSNPLLDKYHEIELELKTSSFGLPVHMESFVGGNSSHVDISGTVKYPFEIVKKRLQNPFELCEIFMLNINIRACTYEGSDNDWLVTVYNVKKYYDPIEDAFPIKFKHLDTEQLQNQFRISLAAKEGPLNTRDHQFQIEATPVDVNTTFIRLHYLFSYSAFGYFTVNSYFSIFGRGKVGFTVADDKQGNPALVTGVRGAVERNVMRYYLAILANLETQGNPSEQRYEKQLTLWYDLTIKYKKQLYEMEKENYLAHKRHDEKTRLQLQKLIKNS
jgi:hypothetical protein